MEHNMPPDTSAKEKIIGGILDLTQLMYILIGVSFGLILGFIFKTFMGELGVIIGLIPGLIFAGCFCFIKIKELSLMKYIIYKNKHKLKTKLLPNIRREALSENEYNQIRNFK